MGFTLTVLFDTHGGDMKRMHWHRPQVTSAHAIAVLALVVGVTGSATAAALITGADIQDDTVSTKDIKDKNLKLKDFKPSERDKLKGEQGPPGPPGPPGTPGTPGAAGPSAFGPPPPGTLVKGGGVLNAYTSAGDTVLRDYAPLPFTTSPALSREDPRNLYFEPSTEAAAAEESAARCTGNYTNPTPTAGTLCVYPVSTDNDNVTANQAQLYPGTAINGDAAESNGFYVYVESAAAGNMEFRYVWAYLAP